MKISAGVNGFGRFGIHLLKYWLDRSESSYFDIKFINDDSLKIEKILDIINNDEKVIFNKYKVQRINDIIRFLSPNGNVHEIIYTNYSKDDIPWIGEPRLVFECSGKNTQKKDCANYITKNTTNVIISATSWDADDTLIFGYNHKSFEENAKVISYGSCTVNAYVPLTNFLNDSFGVLDSDVNVIHNIQKYRLDENYTLNRKFCTLEKSALGFLDFLNEENFLVNYTVIPYDGVSTIDYRFRLEKDITLEHIVNTLDNEINKGVLSGLYSMDQVDIGPEVYNCTTFSSVFIREQIRVLKNNLYIFSYFDNENSTNRYFDLVNYISNKIT